MGACLRLVGLRNILRLIFGFFTSDLASLASAAGFRGRCRILGPEWEGKPFTFGSALAPEKSALASCTPTTFLAEEEVWTSAKIWTFATLPLRAFLSRLRLGAPEAAADSGALTDAAGAREASAFSLLFSARCVLALTAARFSTENSTIGR